MTMTPDTYRGLDIGRQWVTLEAYCEHVGTTERTVRRWLAADELPDARKLDGAWTIPLDARRVPKTAADVVTLPRQVTPTPDNAIDTLDRVLPRILDAAPSFLSIDEAAQLLGISRHAILTPRGRDYFGVVPFGPNGSHVIPLAKIKEIRG